MTAADPLIRPHHFSSQEEVIEAVATTTLETASRAVAEKGRFHLALTGGRTAEKLYMRIRQLTDSYDHWSFWFGDERFLPEDHPQRNSLMASQSLFGTNPPERFHSIPFGRSTEHAAARYQEQLSTEVGLPFDLVLLSLGEDGHIASLFPGHPYNNQEMVVAVENAPKDPPSRISLTATTLSNCRNMILLATGSEKLDALSAWKNGENLPVTKLNPTCGIDLFTDQVF